jgi:hypothetical protein
LRELIRKYAVERVIERSPASHGVSRYPYFKNKTGSDRIQKPYALQLYTESSWRLTSEGNGHLTPGWDTWEILHRDEMCLALM